MDFAKVILSVAGILIVALCLLLFKKSGRFFASAFLSAASGIGGIITVNLLTPLTSVSIPLNAVSVIFSSLTGLSGVISLVLWQVIFTA